MTLGPQLSKEVREDLRREILDGGNVATHHRFAATMEALLSNIASWIAIDSWLGGGQVADINETTHVGAAFDEFRAVAAVTCMCAELADAAVTMSAKGRSYAVAAVLRQVIECEYLLAHFAIDLEQARNWWISTPAQIRKEFETKTMRKAGDFSDTEYWMHCDAGGHPNPKGAFYVEWLDPGRRTWPVAARRSCRLIWDSICTVPGTPSTAFWPSTMLATKRSGRRSVKRLSGPGRSGASTLWPRA